MFLVVSFVAVYYILDLYQTTLALKQIEHQRHLMIQKANELRNSSDYLTRFARTHVITQKKDFLDNYNNVLDIRKGIAKKPLNYDGIYWDLFEPTRSQRHPLSKTISLDDEIKSLPFTDEEYKLLKLSEQKSNILAKLEKEAFKSEQQKATEMLFSKEYHKAKEQIMLPIDKFLYSLQKRTQQQIDIHNKKIASIFDKLLVVFLLAFILSVLMFYMVLKKIIIPIKTLQENILKYTNGVDVEEKKIYYSDEIGMMTENFYEMKEKLDKKYELLEEIAMKDALTKIANRHLFFKLSSELCSLSKRFNTPMALLMIDIDHFKKINDTYGHPIGDEILKHIVSLVNKQIRSSDVFARFGGEEFVVLLPHTELEAAREIAQKLCSQIEKTPYENDKIKVNVTVSIGIALYRNDEDIEETIQRADKALYRAKEGGRNRVEL
jgi:diguanylate cyclase (GGDEF)-like protein